ncbi:MAG: filamentous hemagglutinin N-terminal domain-containing protein, partial [Leptospirillum sp.]
MKRTRTLRTFSLFHKIVACVLSATIPLATLPEAALALPHGGVVSKGSATLGYSTGKLLVTQSTASATFNWGSFNVKSGQSVVYKTPGSSSVSMNYIGGTTPSSINGTVTSNGILYFMNPNGLIFGSGSVVSAAGVMAFGSSTPWGTPTGAVSNAGTITSTTGGTVALVGTSVTNSGTISAPGGEVLLAAGSTVTPISAAGGSSLSVATTGGGLVDDSGIISAETVNGKTGTILVQSGMGSGTTTLESTAVLDASAPNGGNGGAITVNGYKVVLDQIAPLNVSAPSGTPGTITIDPTTLDIGTASDLETVDGNGTAANQSPYLAAMICLIANISLTQSNGSPYPWIPLGTSSSAAFTGTFNGNGHTVSGYTIGTSGTNYSGNDGGFIGYLGSGGTVENLGVSGTIYASGNYMGGVVGDNGGTVEYSYNTGNVSASSTGNDVGGIVGINSGGTVETSYNTGNVNGTSIVGGIVGINSGGTVETSYNT